MDATSQAMALTGAMPSGGVGRYAARTHGGISISSEREAGLACRMASLCLSGDGSAFKRPLTCSVEMKDDQ